MVVSMRYGVVCVLFLIGIQHSLSASTTPRTSTQNTTSGADVTNSTDVNINATDIENSTVSDVITSTMASVTATDAQTMTTEAPSACPRYPVRYEDNALIFTYVPGECEMVVTMETTAMRFPRLRMLFGRGNWKRSRKTRKIRRPLVTFRAIENVENPNGMMENFCEELPTLILGPFVFVDTVLEECQILLTIKKIKDPNPQPTRLPANKKKRKPKTKKLPVYEYVDDNMFL